MSKQFVQDMLNDAYANLEDDYIRKAVDTNRQKVIVTQSNLIEAFSNAYNASRGDGSPDIPRKVFKEAATKALMALRAHIDRPRTNAQYYKGSGLRSSSTQVVFTQSRYVKAPFKALKNAGYKVVLEAITAKGGSKESFDGIKFKSRVQRLHRGNTTVGVARFNKLMNVLGDSVEFGGFINSKEYKGLRAQFPGLRVRYKLGNNGEAELAGFVSIEVAAQEKNDQKEATDFAKIRPVLEASLFGWAKRQKWENQKGSGTPLEYMTQAAEYEILTALTKSKYVKTTSKVKKPKKIKSSGSVKKKERTIKVTPSTKRATKAKKNQSSNQGGKQLLALQSILQAQIQDKVRTNMRTPGLVNRTGRFASSVRVTDIGVTPKGFPSIGYTYDKKPYQVFELGAGKTPWATEDRDPRKLIDRSIRDIAREFLIGRFFTRRV